MAANTWPDADGVRPKGRSHTVSQSKNQLPVLKLGQRHANVCMCKSVPRGAQQSLRPQPAPRSVRHSGAPLIQLRLLVLALLQRPELHSGAPLVQLHSLVTAQQQVPQLHSGAPLIQLHLLVLALCRGLSCTLGCH